MTTQVLFPGKRLAPFIEAYYFISAGYQAAPMYPATTTSYIKISEKSAFVSGQTTRPASPEIEPEEQAGLGIRLRAGGFYALFRIPASELTDRVIRLDEMIGSAASDLVEQTAAAATPHGKVETVERALERVFRNLGDNQSPIVLQAEAYFRQIPDARISTIANEQGYSPRQMQRRINAAAGLSPRLLRRVLRFENVLRMIRSFRQKNGLDWAAIAAACGYSDQAHLIRDFREFSGQTTDAFIKHIH